MRFIFSLLIVFLGSAVFGQVKIIDEIVAVVGDEIILHSDVEAQKEQFIQQGFPRGPELDCQVMESLLFEHLLLHRAKVDSVEVTEVQIQGELDRRIQMFAQQLNGIENLEEYYGKTEAQIRADFHDVLEDQLRAQAMQQQMTANVRVTPDDVSEFFNSIPHDSLQLIGAQVEVSQILIKPEPSRAAEKLVKDKLNGIREGVITGTKDFATEAIINSLDQGSAVKGGELGCVGRGVMVPEFERVALNLKEGEISKVFETEYGFHIIQLMQRNGDEYCARHILMKPKITNDDLQRAKGKLDSISNLIAIDSLSFSKAANRFSHDEGTRFNNGRLINPQTGSTKFDMDEIDPQLFLVIDKLKIGEISDPVIQRNQSLDQAYRIVKLVSRTEAHRANLIDDYQMFQEMTRASLSDETVQKWTESNIERTYIHIDEERGKCELRYNWFKVQ